MGRAIALLLACLPTWAGAQQVCDDRIPGHFPDRFIDRGDGTVLDRATDLVWQRCDLGQTWSGSGCRGYPERLTWQEALRAVDTYNQSERDAGRNGGWRLPNIKELASLINFHCSRPATFDALWDASALASVQYWSATPELRHLDGGLNQAWMVDLYMGQPIRKPIDNALAVRLVREANP